ISVRSFTWLAIVATGAFLMSWSPDLHAQQEPTPAPPATQSQPPPETPATPSSSSKHSPRKYSHANDFLIRGTVFTDKALSLPGAQLRIRRAGEKKFRWQDYTNSRGEFAIRVPQGSQYEILVHAKAFTDQT